MNGGSGTSSPRHALTRFWNATIPVRLNPFAPQLAEAFADGSWIAAWTGISAFAPLVTFGAGLLSPLLLLRNNNVYTESMAFLLLVVVLPILGGIFATTFFAGFVIGDVTNDLLQHQYRLDGAQGFGGQVVSYMLLALLMLRLPILARRLGRESVHQRRPLVAGAVVVPLAYGLLVYLWCQAMIVLIRPTFIWLNNSPTTEAVKNVQLHWPVFVAVAIAGAVARFALERVSLRDPDSAEIITELHRSYSNQQEGGAAWSGLLLLRVVLASLLTTLVLAGTYETWIDAALVAVVVTFLGAWRAGLIFKFPDWWMSAITVSPPLIRFLVATMVGFLLSRLAIRLMWNTSSLRPVMIGAVLTLACFYVLFPSRSSEPA